MTTASATAFVFKPAVRGDEHLLIGLAGGTGSGKTFTAMRLASGLAGNKPFAVIDTEAGRAKHYADRFKFDHGDLTAPFRPERYRDAILAADAARYPVIVVDSFSHEWAGEGGILEWQEEELDRMAGNDWQRRESCKRAAWIKPKMAHKSMVQRLLQIRSHLILCFRAEEKQDQVKDPKTGKWEFVPKRTRTGLNGWIPICEKNLPFELTASFLLTEEAPGIPRPIKLEEQHRPYFPLDTRIDEESGRLLGEWAAGGNPKRAAPAPSPTQSIPAQTPTVAQEFETLINDYAQCNDAASLIGLEKRRESLWSKQGTGGLKQRLKEAADAAVKRVKSRPVEEPQGWIEKLRAASTVAAIDEVWLACTEAFGSMVPLEVDEAYQIRREQLAEQEGRALDT